MLQECIQDQTCIGLTLSLKYSSICIVVHAKTPPFLRYDIFNFTIQSRLKQAAII